MTFLAPFVLAPAPVPRVYVDGLHHREVPFASLPADARAVLQAPQGQALPKLERLFLRDPDDWRAWAVARALLAATPSRFLADRLLEMTETGAVTIMHGGKRVGPPTASGSFRADYHRSAFQAYVGRLARLGIIGKSKPGSRFRGATIPTSVYLSDFDKVQDAYAALDVGLHDWRGLERYRALVPQLLKRFGPDPVLYAYGCALFAESYLQGIVTKNGKRQPTINIYPRPEIVRRYAREARRLAPKEPGILLTTARALTRVAAPERKAMSRDYQNLKDFDPLRRRLYASREPFF